MLQIFALVSAAKSNFKDKVLGFALVCAAKSFNDKMFYVLFSERNQTPPLMTNIPLGSISSLPMLVFSQATSLCFLRRWASPTFIDIIANRWPMHLRGPWLNGMKANLLCSFSGAKFSGSKLWGFLKFFSSSSIFVK